VLAGDFYREFGEALEQSARRYTLKELHHMRDLIIGLDRHEHMHVVGHYLKLNDLEAVFFRNLAEKHLARLFNERLVEYRSSVLGHEDYVVGQLSKAMAVVVEFHFVSM